MESCKQVQALVLVAVLLIGNGSAAPVNGRIAGLTSAAAATDNYVDFLKDLRTGLDIAQDIAIAKLASDIQLPEEDAATLRGESCSRVRFALSVTCDLHSMSESFRQLPGQDDAGTAALSIVTSTLARDACEWTRVIYSEDFPSSTYQLNCTTDSEIASVCAQLDTITFTERTGTQFSDYLKGVWIEDRNIDTELIS